MTAAGKFGLQPSIRNHLGQAHASGALAHAQHIGIIVLPAHFSRENISAQSSTNTLALVGGNGDANAGTTNQDATLSAAGAAGNVLSQLFRKIRVIDAVLTVGTVVNDFDALFSQILFDVLLQMIASVVASNCNFHIELLPSLLIKHPILRQGS